ncbi:MAG: NADH-quinone oxidoreductase subunit J [Dehalococcoidia bacterium]
MDVGIAIAFWVLAVLAVGSAAAVVIIRDIFRAALFLILSFLSIAGLYIVLEADFLAAAQILIYVGAISILLIFAIMLTRDTQRGNPSNKFLVPGLFLAGVILSAIVVAIFTTDWPQSPESPPEATTRLLADALFNKFVLPFEIASVLLLSAMLGAIVIAREGQAVIDDRS